MLPQGAASSLRVQHEVTYRTRSTRFRASYLRVCKSAGQAVELRTPAAYDP
jgi:hypothetical protein